MSAKCHEMTFPALIRYVGNWQRYRTLIGSQFGVRVTQSPLERACGNESANRSEVAASAQTSGSCPVFQWTETPQWPSAQGRAGTRRAQASRVVQAFRCRRQHHPAHGRAEPNNVVTAEGGAFGARSRGGRHRDICCAAPWRQTARWGRWLRWFVSPNWAKPNKRAH